MIVPEIMQHLFDRISHIYFCYDSNGRTFIYVNPAFEVFFETRASDVNIQRLNDQLTDQDRKYVIEKYLDCLGGNPVQNVECRFNINNQERWLRIQPFLKGEIVIGFAEDITVYKQQAHILNLHNSKKNAILNILTHDLAGPLGTIQNLSILLNREIAELKNQKVFHFVGSINKISKSCLKLIRDFVDQEFLESATVNLVKKRVDLVGHIKNLIELYQTEQANLDVSVIFDCKQPQIYAEVDADKFLQVINNLISNALKFTPRKGSVTISAEEKDKEVRLSVSDTGIGIPQKFHASLFKKFSEARRTGLNGERSTGLGMSIIKTIVDWHGASIWFESEVNRGTTFFIAIPK